MKNGILLVNHYNHQMIEEQKSLREAVDEGSIERLVPILMTALIAILDLVPFVLAAGELDSELLAPLPLLFSAASSPNRAEVFGFSIAQRLLLLLSGGATVLIEVTGWIRRKHQMVDRIAHVYYLLIHEET